MTGHDYAEALSQGNGGFVPGTETRVTPEEIAAVYFHIQDLMLEGFSEWRNSTGGGMCYSRPHDHTNAVVVINGNDARAFGGLIKAFSDRHGSPFRVDIVPNGTAWNPPRDAFNIYLDSVALEEMLPEIMTHYGKKAAEDIATHRRAYKLPDHVTSFRVFH